MICNELLSTVALLNLPNNSVVTGTTPWYLQKYICSGLQILRPDLKTRHIETDAIIPNQVVYLANLGCCRIKVISDDTDVFVLLVHYCTDKKLTATLIMEPLLQHAMVRTVKFMMYPTKYGFPKQDEKYMPLPKLKAIPLTNEAFKKKSRRAHFQACIWKAAVDEEPPNIDPLKFGWVKDNSAKSISVIPLWQDIPLTLAEVLKTIQYSCSSDQPYSSLRCGCASIQLPCSLVCKYGGSDRCFNQMTKEKDVADDEKLSGEDKDEEDN